LGNIIGPLILTGIALHWGWRNSLLILSILPLITALSLILLLKGADRPMIEEDIGVEDSLTEDTKSALKNRSARMTIAAQAFLSGATDQSIIVTYTALFLKNGLGLEGMQMSMIYSITMVGGILGTLTIGRYADRIGPLKTAIFSTVIASIATLGLALHRSFGNPLVLNLVVVGIFAFPIFNLMQAHISAISNPLERDILIGIFFTIGFGISSLWSTLIGYTIDLTGNFSAAWTLMALLGGLGVVLQLQAYKLRDQKTEGRIIIR